jgi:hypothetical protein
MLLAVKFIGITLEAFLLSVMLSQACELISAKSDVAVQGGFLLLVLAGAVAIASVFFWFPSLKRLFK